MNPHRGLSSLLALVVIALVVGAAAYWWFGHGNTSNLIVEERSVEGKKTSVSNDLTRYVSTEWNVAFTYPATWKLDEQKYNEAVTYENGLARITVSGDGYSVSLSNIGKGYPGGVNTINPEYIVDGKTVVAMEDEYQDGFIQRVPVCDHVYMDISAPTASKDISDKIIASVDCSVEQGQE